MLNVAHRAGIREVLGRKQHTRVCNTAIEVSLFPTNLFLDMLDTAGDWSKKHIIAIFALQHREPAQTTKSYGVAHSTCKVRYGTVPHYRIRRKEKGRIKGEKNERKGKEMAEREK